MNLRKVALWILAVIMLLPLACGDRDNPADPEDIPHGLVFEYPRIYNSDETAPGDRPNWVNWRVRPAWIYTPPGYIFDPPGEGPKFPILYLLHDMGAAQDSAASYLFSRMDYVADKLIASGEIQPMIIVTVDASTPVGGSFYTDGYSLWNANPQVEKRPAGNFETMIASSLIHIMEDEVTQGYRPLSVVGTRDSRAIGGFGMGGYGALKIALKHPDLFSSVSISDGFVSFDNGLETLIDKVFEENGVNKGDRDAFMANVDTSYSKPFTTLFYSMACAFSPHDSTGDYEETFMADYGVDFPFDYQGNIVQSVWDLWLEHDLTSTLLTTYGEHLDSTELYFEYSDENEFNTSTQSAAFEQQLQSLDADYEKATFSGYTGYPAEKGRFTFERLAEILKFHSSKLSNDPGL